MIVARTHAVAGGRLRPAGVTETSRARPLALAACSATQAHDDDGRYRPVPQLYGVWQTKVTIRDCQTRKEIRATRKVAGDSRTHTGERTFELKDVPGNTIARGCSTVVAARFQ